LSFFFFFESDFSEELSDDEDSELLLEGSEGSDEPFESDWPFRA
jgi:hypothetical protein